MDSRRDFLKKAAALSAAGALPASIRKALAIDPEPGSTWQDAEHVVILMQENRSFDHCYGSLRGVRGFNDPRAVTLPDGNPVWLQSNAAGETYAPFRLDLKGTRSTWMGCLPHGWADQSEARNEGRHDKWLDTKQSGEKAYAAMPLTLGFHNREDLPFYYALADAFTICDQNFCSALTSTTPNRLHLWSGTIRPDRDPAGKVHIRNSDADFDAAISWKTFPERLEEHGISWKCYQNELSISSGLSNEADSWLANFGDNPLEYTTQYHVRFARVHREHLQRYEARLSAKNVRTAHDDETLERVRKEIERWSEANFAALPPHEQALHRKAFVTNEGDLHYRELEPATYRDGETERTMNVPRGDVLHQFRSDVRDGTLPAVSWLTAPQVFSDHPDSPWYGAWYISEVMDILTSRPEVWKKTIFVLCYDENDGYFDHVPPFVPPDPERPGSGKASEGLELALEFVRAPQEAEFRKQNPRSATHAGPIGLGYRVPLVIASPWSRGGCVCSEVFDHTSILRFLEKFLTGKTGKSLTETNITAWRRTVCGDLTSVFRPSTAAADDRLAAVDRKAFFSAIHQAKFKAAPRGCRKLTAAEISAARKSLRSLDLMPRQEAGSRPACALPYELAVHGALNEDRRSFVVSFGAGTALFGERTAGAPFHVYTAAPFRAEAGAASAFAPGRTWAYAVKAGDRLTDAWTLADFQDGSYHLCVHGPNGFFREFRGSSEDPLMSIQLEPVLTGGKATGDVAVIISSLDSQRTLAVKIEDVSYGGEALAMDVAPGAAASVRRVISLQKSDSWYDLRVSVEGAPAFEQRFAGHIETGRESRTDPLMA